MSLKMAIKYHFDGDDEKIKELLTVITKAVHDSEIDELIGYEVKQYSNAELKAENSSLKAENEQKSEVISRQQDRIKFLEKQLAIQNSK